MSGYIHSCDVITYIFSGVTWLHRRKLYDHDHNNDHDSNDVDDDNEGDRDRTGSDSDSTGSDDGDGDRTGSDGDGGDDGGDVDVIEWIAQRALEAQVSERYVYSPCMVIVYTLIGML